MPAAIGSSTELKAEASAGLAGGRFHHILGASDKGLCVKLAAGLYRQAFGEVKTVGLGDGLNDAAFLKVVDIPVVIRSAASARLQSMIENVRVTDHPGP